MSILTLPLSAPTLHPASRADNVITNMQNSGIVLMESFGNDIHHNFVDGAASGIRMTMGAGVNKVYDNVLNDISDGETHLNSDIKFTNQTRFTWSPCQRLWDSCRVCFLTTIACVFYGDISTVPSSVLAAPITQPAAFELSS